MSSSWSVEVETKSPAAAVFKATFIDWDKLGPKLIPELITDVTLISGDGFCCGGRTFGRTKLESATPHIKVEPKGNESIVKLTTTYKAIAGAVVAEDIKKGKEGFIKSVKAVEEYLAANPGTYAKKS
ncbi:pathogenesis-related protein 1-like [Phalaenopsis equestris]|uniref:pathogenesis-related protein 1-like n=1 Tax=Phalaenopsis equestris TaxID=78828 RepID=UPI0009E64076|nr:pathogenesis-related protein 1-like [Phalaenopsis equestris]